MSENNSPNTLDQTTPTDNFLDSLNNQQVTPPKPKFPIFSLILLLVLSVVSVIAIYLFLQVRELSMSQAAPSPTPSPLASIDPTSKWQIYSNPKIGFQFNYPNDWELTTEVSDVIELMKGHARIIFTYRFDAIGGSTAALEGSSYELNGLKLFKYKSVRDNQVEWGISDSLVANSDMFRYAGKPYSIVLRYPSKENGELYVAEFDQILSTFKFTDSSMSYTCPASGYVDCMPSPDGPKTSCTKEAMDWYKANCPDFQGGAL